MMISIECKVLAACVYYFCLSQASEGWNLVPSMIAWGSGAFVTCGFAKEAKEDFFTPSWHDAHCLQRAGDHNTPIFWCFHLGVPRLQSCEKDPSTVSELHELQDESTEQRAQLTPASEHAVARYRLRKALELNISFSSSSFFCLG